MNAGEAPGGVLLAYPRSAGEARREVAQIGSGLHPDVLGDLVLLVSEIVTNAIRYGGLLPDDRVELRVQIAESWVRVDVTDPGRSRGVPRQRVPTDEGGWGLNLVSAVAQRWGTDLAPTRVWFELARQPATA